MFNSLLIFIVLEIFRQIYYFYIELNIRKWKKKTIIRYKWKSWGEENDEFNNIPILGFKLKIW